MVDSSAFEDVYVSIPRGGPLYVSDMVGPLTGVSQFQSCVEHELQVYYPSFIPLTFQTLLI